MCLFHITHKKEERKEQLHNSAQVTAAPSGGFSQVSLPHFEHNVCCNFSKIKGLLSGLVSFANFQFYDYFAVGNPYLIHSEKQEAEI